MPPHYSLAANILSRRGFLRSLGGGSLGLLLTNKVAAEGNHQASRVRGMLLGTLIGDALGGPVEFQALEDVGKLPNPPKQWQSGESLTRQALADTEARLLLRPYAPLRPIPESYAHWLPDAVAGTVTDDSRHKFVLMQALRQAGERDKWPLTGRSLAQAYLDWPTSSIVPKRPEYHQLSSDWLDEFNNSAHWVLGQRDPAVALPPERMWTGLPTCCGQMTLPPLAAVYSGQPDAAYRAAYALAFFDNGFGKDLNAALIAGLAAALATQPPLRKGNDWESVMAAMRETDPFAYGKVPWTPRPLDLWLDRAIAAAKKCDGQPAKLFAELNATFAETIKWQAEVPFVVSIALLTLCPDNPLAALQLSIEWGHDTDSYAALTGALIGARYGEEIFPVALRTPVVERLTADYGESVDEWAKVLANAAERQKAGKPVCAFD